MSKIVKVWHAGFLDKKSINSDVEMFVCGSLVVLRCSLSLTINGSYGSEDDQIAYIETNIYGQKDAFLCIYATNQFSPEFFGTISKTLCDLQDVSVIFCADINAVLDPLHDRSSPPSQHIPPSTVASKV